jgi:hypothetical protein
MLLQNDSLERFFHMTLNRHHSYIVTTVIYVRFLILLENDRIVYFGNFARDVICIIVTRYSMRIGNSITINKHHLESVSPEYSESLTKFMEEFKKYKPDLVN